MKPSQSLQSSKGWKFIAWLMVGVFFLTLAWRQHAFVDHYAVNVMYWDQWGIYGPMFEQRGWWESFSYQHGPHRQGLGGVMLRVLAYTSDWNSRWDAFAVSWTLIAAAFAGLGLAWRCGLRAPWAFAAVPLLYFNLRQYEQFAGPSNVSHGALPLLLVSLYALAWFVKNRTLRLGLVVILSFLAVFTGFGFYVGIISLILLSWEAVKFLLAKEWRAAILPLMALAGVVAVWWLFLQNYRNETCQAGVHEAILHPGQTFHFIGVMLANACGVWGTGGVATTFGLAFFTGLVALAAYYLLKIVRHGRGEIEPRNVVLFSLSAFVVMYCISTALGRLGEGLEAARASRYVTLMTPGGLAVFLLLAGAKTQWLQRRMLPIFLVLLAVLTLRLHPGDIKQAEAFRTIRSVWASTYLQTRDVQKANEQAQQEIFPGSTMGVQLRYLEDHRLNFFKNEEK